MDVDYRLFLLDALIYYFPSDPLDRSRAARSQEVCEGAKRSSVVKHKSVAISGVSLSIVFSLGLNFSTKFWSDFVGTCKIRFAKVDSAAETGPRQVHSQKTTFFLIPS